MNAPLAESAIEQDGAESRPESRLAGWLRWLGTLAVMASGVTYMVQGMDDIAIALRNWVYLLLMLGLAGAGALCRLQLEDAKSARLLFALAAALVPVQFSQIGGMIHELFQQAPAAATGVLGWFSSGTISAGSTAVVGLATLLLALPMSYAAFSILARPVARQLSFAFLLPNALLLIPARDSVWGLVVLAVLAGLALLVERHLLGADARLRTLEGRSVRAITLLPLAIATVRFALHTDDLHGACALLGIASLLATWVARHWLRAGWWAALVGLSGYGGAALAWSVFAISTWAPETAGFEQTLFLCTLVLPVIALWLWGSLGLPRGGRMLRVAACGIALLLAQGLLLELATYLSMLAGLLIGGCLLAFGLNLQLREPVLTGALICAAALLTLGLSAFGRLDVSGWLLLALTGIGCVLGASCIERYGRRAASRLGASWSELASWK